MLDVFDPESDHGSVYRALVSEPSGAIASLALQTNLSQSAVRTVLQELREAGAAMPADPDGERWSAERPDLIAARELRRHDDRRSHLHRMESYLSELYWFARLQDTGRMDVDLIDDRTMLFERTRKLLEGAREQVRGIDRPPYYRDEAETTLQEELQSEQLSAGIGFRTIYQEAANDSPVRNASMMRTVAQGANARVLADPPAKLLVIDNDVALLVLDPPAQAGDLVAALLVHQHELLTVMINVFESLWRLAVPINLTCVDNTLGTREQRILTMMASGATDEAIAHRLGLSRRTVVRGVGQLLEHLGATTRFQAGAQAARRGWL